MRVIKFCQGSVRLHFFLSSLYSITRRSIKSYWIQAKRVNHHSPRGIPNLVPLLGNSLNDSPLFHQENSLRWERKKGIQIYPHWKSRVSPFIRAASIGMERNGKGDQSNRPTIACINHSHTFFLPFSILFILSLTDKASADIASRRKTYHKSTFTYLCRVKLRVHPSTIDTGSSHNLSIQRGNVFLPSPIGGSTTPTIGGIQSGVNMIHGSIRPSHHRVRCGAHVLKIVQ